MKPAPACFCRTHPVPNALCLITQALGERAMQAVISAWPLALLKYWTASMLSWVGFSLTTPGPLPINPGALALSIIQQLKVLLLAEQRPSALVLQAVSILIARVCVLPVFESIDYHAGKELVKYHFSTLVEDQKPKTRTVTVIKTKERGPSMKPGGL